MTSRFSLDRGALARSTTLELCTVDSLTLKWYNVNTLDMQDATHSKQAILPTAIYTVVEASNLLGVDKRELYGAIKSGELVSREIGNGYKITGDNLLRFAGSITYVGSAPTTTVVTPAAKYQDTYTEVFPSQLDNRGVA